ncbi:MAG: hypothetical protein U0350_49155 [Caldilineaceae bacterium]
MSTATQISTFFIPAEIWKQGHPLRPQLPPLALPARDALDIERRALKRVNLRNESLRYILCCERIQGIVHELSQEGGVLKDFFIWPIQSSTKEEVLATSAAYLALIDTIRRSKFMDKISYPRITALFFPPEHATRYSKILSDLCQQPHLNQLLERAAKDASLAGTTVHITAEHCRKAIDQRLELSMHAVSQNYGLVDVLELI